MVPMHALKRKGAFHEPPPLPTLSPALGGWEGCRRPGAGDSEWFMVPMHAKKRKGAFHEPYSQLIGNEQSDRGRFMASNHVKILEVFPFQEPNGHRLGGRLGKAA